MKVDESLVDLRSIKAPFLNIIAQKDDLVAPASSIALNKVVGSKDLYLNNIPCISEVNMWILSQLIVFRKGPHHINHL